MDTTSSTAAQDSRKTTKAADDAVAMALAAVQDALASEYAAYAPLLREVKMTRFTSQSSRKSATRPPSAA